MKNWFDVEPVNGKTAYFMTEPLIVGASSEPYSVHITADSDIHRFIETLPYIHRRAMGGLMGLEPGVSRQWYWLSQNYDVADAWLAIAYSIENYIKMKNTWEPSIPEDVNQL